MLIGQSDIMLGMTRAAVRESWGPPDEVEVAGQPMYGNERWHYTEQMTSSEGYTTERRIVIFEAGRVVGWETN
jgi:outer membrane protein assembly factor BamE (lipoprotein component of BamABCDE complex)